MKPIALVLCVAFLLTSCGNNSDDDKGATPKAAENSDFPSVAASRVHGIGYDEATHVLTVHFFEENRVVEFRNVSKETYDSLIRSVSKGEYIRKNISGKYGETVLKETSGWMTVYDDHEEKGR